MSDNDKNLQVVTILSGGLDSTVLAYSMNQPIITQHLITFDYGQRHKKEIEFARQTASKIGARHDVIDLSGIGSLLTGNALTDVSVSVPDGTYDENNMGKTVVQNRNAIMLSIAYAIAASDKADFVAIGVHSGDHFIYMDCRPEFLQAFEAMEVLSLGSAKPKIFAPFRTLTKTAIVRMGAVHEVPFEDTWSCYQGGLFHCGVCGTCLERKQAFENSGIPDPTIYER